MRFCATNEVSNASIASIMTESPEIIPARTDGVRPSITEVPSSLTPAALPSGLRPDLVITIQPGEMVFAKPSPRFWLGTDENAKDVLSRVMHGSRLSLLAGGLSIATIWFASSATRLIVQLT